MKHYSTKTFEYISRIQDELKFKDLCRVQKTKKVYIFSFMNWKKCRTLVCLKRISKNCYFESQNACSAIFWRNGETVTFKANKCGNNQKTVKEYD